MATTKKRGHGAGSVVKGSSGVYVFYWTDANGKRHKRSLRTRNRTEAMERAADLEKATTARDRESVLFEAARARRIIRQRELPLADVWPEYLATRPENSKGTQGNHKRHLNRFLEWLGLHYPSITSFTQIDEDTAHEYASELWASGMAAATFNYHRTSLMTITSSVARKYGIERNPWSKDNVKAKNGEQQRRQRLTRAQVDALLDNATDPELRTLLMLGANAGMRLKDAALLRWTDVDLRAGKIRYRANKTRKHGIDVSVRILPDLQRALVQLDQTTEYVLPGMADLYENHVCILQRSIAAALRTVAPERDPGGDMQRLRIRAGAGFHALRHYFCSICATGGVSLSELEVMTGDKAKTLSEYYVEVEVDDSRVIRAFGEVTTDPERAQLRQLVDALPMDAVRSILDFVKQGQRAELPAESSRDSA